jgi:hypothetical protein
MTNAQNTRPTTSELLRWTGLAAMAAAVIFAGIQPIHPPDLLASVTTTSWAIIIGLKLVMCLLFLVGIAGIYVRQADRAGWLGFAGFAMLTLSWWLQTGYVFIDAFVLPVLVGPAPGFIDSFLGMVNPASPVTMDIGPMGTVYAAVGILYMLGGLLFGIATVRAGVLPRAPAILLAVAAVLTPLAVLLPHEIQRLAAVPVAVAVGWLGYAVWTSPKAATAEVDPARGAAQATQ